MNLRTSSYTIWINLPNSPDRALLVHGISGAYDEVSRDVVAYLKSRRNGPRSKPLHGEWLPDSGDSAGLAPTLTADTLDRLESRGYLTALSVEEELNLFREVVGQLHKRRTTFSYIIVPTYDCNLRCPYCFQGSLRTNPSNRHLLTTMKPTMWNQILNAIERLEADGGLAAFKGFRSFTLFGGEPLLSSNVPLIEYMLNEALTRGPASFSAITNGTDLDSYKDLLGPTLIQWLQITVDGPPETHNKSRIYENGNGSFDRIARNIELALQRDVVVKIRINVSKKTVSQVPALALEASRRGWTNLAHFRMYAAPIHASEGTPDLHELLDNRELTLTLQELTARIPETAIIETADSGIRARAFALFQDPELDPSDQFTASFCGAHNNMWIFDPFGDIYACWERLANPRIRIGRVDEKGMVQLEAGQLELWRARTVATNKVCERCPFALNCGGGCAVAAEARNGGMYSNYCDAYEKRFKASVAEAYEEYTGKKNGTGANRGTNVRSFKEPVYEPR